MRKWVKIGMTRFKSMQDQQDQYFGFYHISHIKSSQKALRFLNNKLLTKSYGILLQCFLKFYT